MALAELAAVFLGVAAVGLLAHRLDQSVIPAYIVAGLLLGPHGPFPIVAPTELLAGVAELGLIFLLLFLGLEFSLARFFEAKERILRAGTLDAAVHLPLGFVLGLLFGFNVLESLFLASIVYMSSSAIIVKGLMELGRLANRETESILGVLVYEDILIAVLLAVLSGLALDPSGGVVGVAASVAVALGFTFAFLISASYLGKPLSRALRIQSAEVFILLVAALVLGAAYLAEVVGIEAAIGAFLLGLVFSETAQSDRIHDVVVPLRDVFAAVFFFFFGMQLDPAVLVDPVVLGLLAVALPITAASKLLVGEVAGRWEGYGPRQRLNTGTALVIRGEFSVVAAQVALGAGLAGAALLAGFAGAYVLVLALVGPLLMRWSGRWPGAGRATGIGGTAEDL